ncbi:thiamine phosphate synthase [Facilibium subflavum]|uniref:thiamine phosphate synthase n=1 Tax=Facilibium subflavum TaxID=2219058 RepID=UPI000E654D9A|nr:thiamine phosphate synthase [Facilibium subflavum]
MRQYIKPLVWFIGGIDPTNSAGIGVDLKIAYFFDVHAISLITANTAQNNQQFIALNPVSDDVFCQQFDLLMATQKPKIIKSGLLATVKQVERLSEYLQQNPDVLYICDPVFQSTSGGVFCDKNIIALIKQKLLPLATLITPNIAETCVLLGNKMVQADKADLSPLATQLAAHYQVGNVLIKGGHFAQNIGLDCLYINGCLHYFKPKIDNMTDARGTGCALAASIASVMAYDAPLEEAVCLAKSHLTQALSKDYYHFDNKKILAYQQNKAINHHNALPLIYREAIETSLIFPEMARVGFYPVVDDVNWIERLAKLQVKTIQLRLKGLPIDEIRRQIIKANQIAKEYNLALFINDYWQLAIEYNCFGVHLGQEDLDIADFPAIAKAGLRLGLSTHNHYELARALTINPSYVALGPIFHTNTKKMKFTPRGLEMLHQWRRLTKAIQLVAIGGIDENNIDSVWQTGVDGIAVVSYVTKAKDYAKCVEKAQDVIKS